MTPSLRRGTTEGSMIAGLDSAGPCLAVSRRTPVCPPRRQRSDVAEEPTT